MLFCVHIVSVNNIKILATSDLDLHVKVKESLLISRDDEPVLNKNGTSQANYRVWIHSETRDVIITYNPMHRTDKYSQHSSIFWPIWLNSSEFVYELGGCGFESCCCHLKFRYGICF